MPIIHLDNFARYPLFGLRPTSPHITIYRFPFPAVLSVLHRGTGIFLYFVILSMFYIESMTSMDIIDYDIYYVYHILNRPDSLFAYIIYAGIVFSIVYHILNGFRHYIWNTRRFLTLTAVYVTGYLIVLFSLILTTLIMYYIIYYI